MTPRRRPNQVLRQISGRFAPPPKAPASLHDVRAAAMAQTMASLQFLIQVRDDRKVRTALRLEAAQALLDRGLGRPHQSQTTSLSLQSPAPVPPILRSDTPAEAAHKYHAVRGHCRRSIVAQPLCQRVRQQLRLHVGDDLEASGPDLMAEPTSGKDVSGWPGQHSSEDALPCGRSTGRI
jgi:hypothetical protein